MDTRHRIRDRGHSRAGRATLMLGLIAAFFACGGDDDSGPIITCGQFGGVWNVSLDYGNGLVAHQQWTIAQAGCDVTITGDPPDTYGPSLGAEPGRGSAGDADFWASWTNTWDTCRFFSEVRATVAGNSFSGNLDWVRTYYGAGACPSANGRIQVTATR